MISFRIDTAGLQQKLAAAAQQSAEAKADALAVYGDAFVNTIERIAPRDTNRYIRGWLMAGNAAGLGPWTPPNLNRSSRADEYLKKLEDQVERIAKNIERYEKGIRGWYDHKPERHKSPWYFKAKREVQKLRKRLGKAYEHLLMARGDEFFMFFEAKAYVERKNQRKLSTVRVKLYGGTGRLEILGQRAVLTLHNLEPHSKIIEARFGVVAVATRGAEALGTRKASLAYRERIRGVAGAASAMVGGRTSTRRRAG